MPIREKTIRSIGDLLKVLPTIFGTAKDKKNVWFRGHASEKWNLLPTILRSPNKVSSESMLMKRFKQHAVPFLEKVPEKEWEWLFLMQHYGVSTRLLDFSESPLVGLYFALMKPIKPADEKKNGILWCMYPNTLNALANLESTSAYDIPSFGDDDVLDKYLPSRVLNVESTNVNPLAIIAPRHFKRLYAQQGVFVLFHRNKTPIENLEGDKHVFKLVIPSASKKKMRSELEFLMINELAMFPELEKVGRRVYEIQI